MAGQHFFRATTMPSLSDGNTFFINEFDESMDQVLLDVAKSIHEQNAYHKHNPAKILNFFINSEGGDATRAFSLVALMEHAKGLGFQVNTTVLSDAHSAGSIVAVAGSKGLRSIAPGGNYMLHYGEVDVTANGPVSLERITAANQIHFKRIKNHYLKYTDLSSDELESLVQWDNAYIGVEHALQWGLADSLYV